MPQKSQRLANLAVTLHAALTATLPAPALATDGGSLATWKVGGSALAKVAISIDAAGTCVLSNAFLCAYDATDAKWRAVATLNSGGPIALTATLGWEETFDDVGSLGRLAVYGTLSASSVTIKAVPIEVTP